MLKEAAIVWMLFVAATFLTLMRIVLFVDRVVAAAKNTDSLLLPEGKTQEATPPANTVLTFTAANRMSLLVVPKTSAPTKTRKGLVAVPVYVIIPVEETEKSEVLTAKAIEPPTIKFVYVFTPEKLVSKVPPSSVNPQEQ
ncbi:MAG: hypothetical protein EBQ89_04370 [Alphaproteobacteria bacterium]|nr:hypothetical protein [Alphaproteobacteria bacterium]